MAQTPGESISTSQSAGAQGLDGWFRDSAQSNPSSTASPAPAGGGLNAWFEEPKQAAQQRGAAPAFSPISSETLDQVAAAEGLTPKQRQVMGALLEQESGSGANAATSIDGARGAGQIMPDTFRRYAKAGEHIDDPASNLAVSARIIKDLGSKSGDDPARIATGYFSGSGNINSGAGNAWRNDAADGNGKRVSSYVTDVLGRLTGSAPAAAAEPAAQPNPLANAPKWAAVTAKPEYQALSDADKQGARDAYFQRFIAPNIDPEQTAQYREWFDKQTAEPEKPGIIDRAATALGGVRQSIREAAGTTDEQRRVEKLKNMGLDAGVMTKYAKETDTPNGQLPKQLQAIADLPATDEFKQKTRDQWAAADPAARQKMEQAPGHRGYIAKQLNSIYGDAKIPTSAQVQGESRAEPTDFDFDAQKAYNDPKSLLSNPIVRGAVKGVEGYRTGSLGMAQFAADALGADDFAAAMKKGAKVSGNKTAAMGEPTNFVQRNFEGAVSSIAQQLPALVGGAATGSEALVLGSMFAQTFGQEYGQAREAGKDIGDAAKRAAIFGSFEVAGEKLGLGEQFRLIRQAAAGRPTDVLAGWLTNTVKKELPGELFTTSGQFATDKAESIGLNPDASFSDYLNQMADTTVQTLMQSGIMGGGVQAAGMAADKLRGSGARASDAADAARSTALGQWERNGLSPSAAASRAATAPAAGRIEPALEEETTAAPAVAPVTPSAATGIVDQDVLDYADSRYRQLVAQRDGEIGPMEGDNGDIVEGQQAGAGLNADDAAELALLQKNRGNAGALAAQYGFDTSQPDSTTVAAAANEAATSPENDRPEPTQAQKKAGNYRKGSIKLHGLDLAIENPQGSSRSGVSRDGRAWSNTLADHYGYVRGTTGADGDGVDVFVGPHPQSTKVFVVDQIDPDTGRFDEVKAMLGYDSQEAADAAYHANYEAGWNGMGHMTEVPVEGFKAWLDNGDTSKAFGGGQFTAAAGEVPETAALVQRQRDAMVNYKAAAMSGDEAATQAAGDELAAARADIKVARANVAARAQSMMEEAAAAPLPKPKTEKQAREQHAAKPVVKDKQAAADAKHARQDEEVRKAAANIAARAAAKEAAKEQVATPAQTALIEQAVKSKIITPGSLRAERFRAGIMDATSGTAPTSAERSYLEGHAWATAKQTKTVPESEVVQIKDNYGRPHRVRKSDLEGNADRIPTVRKNGEIWGGEEIPRSIIKSEPATAAPAAKPKTEKTAKAARAEKKPAAPKPKKTLADQRPAKDDIPDLNNIERQTVEVKGERRPITNSNGQLIAADTNKQLAFYRWFGDSKVVDEDGRPQVVYHGSAMSEDEDIDKFLSTRMPSNSFVGAVGKFHGIGSFFTESTAVANSFPARWEYEQTRRTYPVYVAVDNPKRYKTLGKALADFNDNYSGDPVVFVNELKKQGYDGLTFSEGPSYAGKKRDLQAQVWVAFDAQQVKSALGNNGNFDPNNASILRDIDLTQDGPLSRQSEPVRVNTLAKLKALEKKREAGKLTDAEYQMAVQMLIGQLEHRADAQQEKKARPRERGDLWLRERLLRAKRTGELSADQVDFALWALDQNPNIANDLGISLRESKGDGVAGSYIPGSRIISLVKGNGNMETVVHEIMHHTERMMPPAIQQGIVKEWSRAMGKAWKNGTPAVREALGNMILSSAGDKQAHERMMDAFRKGTLNYDDHYQLVNASEYWAVNASDILAKRADAAGRWVAQARQWLREMIEKIKNLLNLPSSAPVLAGLQRVLDGQGKRLSTEMLIEMSNSQAGAVLDGLNVMDKGSKDLVITHNLTEANLLHAMRMGGIAVPSLAVTKKGASLNGFGEITMIGSRDLADPKGYAKTQVYGADIYSPRYPSVEHDIDAKAKAAFDKKFGPMAEKMGIGLPDKQDLERKANEELERNQAVMGQFLKDNGIEPEIVMRKPSMSEDRVDRLEQFGLGDYLSKTNIYELINDPVFVERVIAEQLDAYRSANDERLSKRADRLEKDNDAQSGVARDVAYKIIADAKQRQRPEADKYETQRAMEKQVEDAAMGKQFRQYVADEVAAMSKGERIFKGFSNSGRRTYIEHTIENVVKILKKELRGGENFNYGVGSLRAHFTPQFKTIAQIQKEKGRLVSAEQFEQVKKDIDAEFFAVGEAIGGKDINMDTVIGILEEAPKKGLERAAKEYGFTLSDDAKQKAAEFLTHLQHLPTEYFEAKVLREVDLAEFSGAVIPSSASDEVRAALAARGVPVREYTNDEERKQAVQSFAEQLDNEQGNVLFDITRPRTAAQKAQQQLVEEFGKPTFSNIDWWDKSIGTQYHKAAKNPLFKKVFDLAIKRENAVSLTAIRAAELAPGFLPRVDDFMGAMRTLAQGRRTGTQTDLAGKALLEGTLDGASVIDGKVWTTPELRAKGLNDQGIALYRQARAAIDASLDEVAAAEGYSTVHSFVPKSIREDVIDDPRGAQSVLSAALAKRIQLDELHLAAQQRNNASPAAVDAAKAKLLQSYDVRDTLNEIFERADQLKKAGYTPLMRFGNYYVQVEEVDPATGKTVINPDTGKPNTLYFSRFETEAEASDAYFREQVANRGKDNIKVTSGPVNDESFKMYSGISPETLELFADVVGAKEATEKFYQVALSERSALKRRITRNAIEGYSENMPRVLANFITSNGKFAAQRYYNRDINNAIRYIPRLQGDVQKEAIRLKEYIDNPGNAGSIASALSFTWFLGGNVASALINATQPVMMTLPYLSQFGAGRAAAALTKAAPYAMGRKQIMDADLKAALKRGAQEGKVDAQEIFHLYSVGIQGVASILSGKLSKLPLVGSKVKGASESARARMNALGTLWGMPFAMVEGFNRRLTFIAAWDVAKATGNPDPYQFAVDAVDQTQGVYNKVNRPNWARGPVGRVVFTFAQFKIMNVEMLKRLATMGGPQGKKAAAMYLAVLILASGLAGVPYSDDIDDIIDTAGQWLGYNTNMKRKKREWAYKTLGQGFGDLALYGVSSHLPVDIGGRMGLGNMFPATGILKPSGEGNRAQDIMELGGPAVSGLGRQVFDAYDAASMGNYGKAAMTLMPTAIKNAATGAEMAATGKAKDMKGRVKTDVTPGEGLAKAIGLNPTVVAEKNRANMPINQDLALQRLVESSVVEQWAQGVATGNKEDVAAAMARMKNWNEKNPDTPVRISKQQIDAKIKTLLTPTDTRLLKGAPKEMRARVVEGLKKQD